MCKAPKPPKTKEPKKPQFLRNRYLDEYVGDASAVKSLKTGRNTLRIPTGVPTPVGGRLPGSSLVDPEIQRRPPTTTSGGGANQPPPGGDFRPIGPRGTRTQRR